VIAVVDIGNSCTKGGIFDASGALVDEKRFPTGNSLPNGAAEFFSGVKKAVVGSVVPALTKAWAQHLMETADLVHVAGYDSPWGFRIAVEEPARVGVDRLANLEGALRFPGTVLVVDAGTATKFDLLEGVEKRSFPGGAIAPGLGISYEALLSKAAQLPRIDLEKHSPLIGYNTETAIRSGVLNGFASQVDGMVLRILKERNLAAGASVVATGGNSVYLRGRADLVSHFRPHLTLEGLYGLAKKL
jgi:type III pantothenate kinase